MKGLNFTVHSTGLGTETSLFTVQSHRESEDGKYRPFVRTRNTATHDPSENIARTENIFNMFSYQEAIIVPEKIKSNMSDDHLTLYPDEPSLLRTCQQATNTTSMLGDSFSSIMTTEDDYGECDISLRSYHSSKPGIDKTFGLSQQEANQLLQERLRKSALSSGDLHVASNGRCTFVTAGDHTVDVSIRDDTMAVVISTVVHKGKDVHKTHRPSGASYSLMTKMTKHNALLSQAATGRGKPDSCRVGVYAGSFFLFSNMSLSMLSSNWELELVLGDFIVKAAQIGKDFANTQRFRTRGSSTPLATTPGAKAA